MTCITFPISKFSHTFAIFTPNAGNDDEVNENGSYELTELNGKPVQTVIARNPLRAWSLALTKLGLIDEEIVIRALEALDAGRKEKAAIEAKGNKKKKGGDDDIRTDLYSLLEEFEKDQEDPEHQQPSFIPRSSSTKRKDQDGEYWEQTKNCAAD
jgi:hypothetical protein